MSAPTVTVDGMAQPDGTVRLSDDGVEHRVVVSIRAPLAHLIAATRDSAEAAVREAL